MLKPCRLQLPAVGHVSTFICLHIILIHDGQVKLTVNVVVVFEVAGVPRQNVKVDVRHRLPCVLTILHSNVLRRRPVFLSFSAHGGQTKPFAVSFGLRLHAGLASPAPTSSRA